MLKVTPLQHHGRLDLGHHGATVGVDLDARGRVGALVVGVEHAVAVVVRVGAAVVVLEAVEVLGLVRAVVAGVDDAVAVVVRIGAAVLVLEAVAILGLVGAAVLGVGDAVAVVVRVGAAVAVLEAVEVLGLVGAGVQVVEDAVAVLVLVAAEVDRDADEALEQAGVGVDLARAAQMLPEPMLSRSLPMIVV